MTRLEDKQKRELPPPPAATRRGANPWKFSETARKQEARPESGRPALFEELLKQAPVAEEMPETPASSPDGKSRSRNGMWFLAIAGIAILIVLRVVLEAGDSGDWVGAIGPLIAIAIIAHAVWRIRRKRSESGKIRKG